MNKALKFAAIAALPLTAASVAYAQSINHDVNITATVPIYCTVDTTNTSSNVALNVNQTTGAVSTAPQSVTIGKASCNTRAAVTSKSSKGGVTNSNTTVPQGFANVIHYKGDVSFAGFVQSSITTTGTAGQTGSSNTTGGAEGGDFVVTITPIAPTLPLTQGSYSDTLTVTVTPQP